MQPTHAPGRPRVVLLVVAAATFLASLDLFIVNIAFPDIARSFGGTSVSSLSWVLNAYTIVFAALLMPAGRLADHLGRRRLFLAGLVVFVVASAACAAAWSVPALVAFRIVQAVGAALLMSTSLALLLDAFPPARRGAAIGIWAAAGGVAAALGPPLGGLLVEASWRWVFIVNLPVGLAAAVAGTRALRESRADEGRWPDALGTLALGAGMAGLAWAFVGAPDHGWGSARTLGTLAASALALAAVAYRAAHTPAGRAPVLELAMFRVRPFALASLAGLLFTAGFSAMLLGGVLFLTGPWQESVLRAGLSLAPGPVMAAAFALPAGRLAQRIGAGPVAATGSALFALGCLWWLWRMDLSPDFAGALLPGMLVGGAGVGLILPSISAAVASTLPPARLATGSAVLTAGRQLGAVLGVAIFVGLLGEPRPDQVLDRFQAGWIFMASAAALGALVALGIGRADHPELAAARALRRRAPSAAGG
jgi:EmrB/QacA subfamily drug resistance transporter